MGCPVCLWLLISLGCMWGTGRGARETVLGTLGKATILRIPHQLQDLTRRFGASVWKRDTEDPQSKLVLLKYSDGNYTNYMEERTRFHELNFSLEILNTSRQDRQLYEYIVSKGPEEKVWQIKLEVYEPVSNPSIQILNWTLANSSCTVTLNCTAERGDNISYSWGSQNTTTTTTTTTTSGLCSHDSNLLRLSYTLQGASIACTCTATNPISTRVVTFNTSECSYKQGGSAGLRREHLVLVVVVPIIIIIIITMLLTGAFMAVRSGVHLAGQEQDHTIYSQVQRVEKPKGVPTTEHPSCTTIYAAATGLPPDTALAPSRAPHPPRGPPTVPPALQHPPLQQGFEKEPTTVYACVMMPMA